MVPDPISAFSVSVLSLFPLIIFVPRLPWNPGQYSRLALNWQGTSYPESWNKRQACAFTPSHGLYYSSVFSLISQMQPRPA